MLNALICVILNQFLFIQEIYIIYSVEVVRLKRLLLFLSVGLMIIPFPFNAATILQFVCASAR